jgi:hypothetical protein
MPERLRASCQPVYRRRVDPLSDLMPSHPDNRAAQALRRCSSLAGRRRPHISFSIARVVFKDLGVYVDGDANVLISPSPPSSLSAA